MKEKLTKMQRCVFEFVKQEIKDKGYPPSVREICEAVKLSSTSSVHAHLQSLEEKGYIHRPKAKNRSIEVLEDGFYEQTRGLVHIPIVGVVTAGIPILAVENIEDTFPVPVEYINSAEDHFMLRVRGDSMINRGIHNNDLVIVKQQPTATNGDMVVALLDDSATIKTFYKEKNRIRLQPENPNYTPIYVNTIMILGVVVGLFRKY